jgi:hypothetical protein
MKQDEITVSRKFLECWPYGRGENVKGVRDKGKIVSMLNYVPCHDDVSLN